MAIYDPGLSRVPSSFDGRRFGVPRLVGKKSAGGVRGSQGKGDRDYLRSRGCWECGGLLKNPAAAIVLGLRPATLFAGRKSLKETTLCIKNHPVWKKHECSPSSYCNSLVPDLSGSSVWASTLYTAAMTEQVARLSCPRLRLSADGSLVVMPFLPLRAWASNPRPGWSPPRSHPLPTIRPLFNPFPFGVVFSCRIIS